MAKSLGAKCVWLVVLAFAVVDWAAADIAINGRVLSSGSPLTGAEIQLFPAKSGWWDRPAGLEAIAETSSGGGGDFSLAAPFPGLWRIRVTAPDHAPQEIVLEPLLAPITLPDLHLPAGRRLEVQIRDAGGRPSLAWLVFDPERPRPSWTWQPAAALVETDALGRAVLTVPHRFANELGVWVGGEASWPRNAAVGSGDRLEITLEKPRTRALRLLDPAGQPIADAWIWSAEPIVLPLARTDTDGRAAVAVPKSRPVDLLVTTEDGWRVRRQLPPRNGSAESERTTLTVTPRTVRGKVLDHHDGTPVGGAVVWIRSEFGFDWGRSDRQGAFALTTHEPALSVVQTLARGYRGARTESDGGHRLSIDLTPRRLGIGQIIDAHGQAVVGAEVRWRRSPNSGTGSPRRVQTKTVLTGSEGRFLVSNPPGPPSASELEVLADGYPPLKMRVEAIEEVGGVFDLGVIELDSVESLAGWVFNDQGEPLAGADVLLLATDDPSSIRWMMSKAPAVTVSTEDGSFVFENAVPAGTYVVRVAKEGFLPMQVAGVDVPASDPLSVVLDEAATVTGWVFGDRGSAVEGALVTIQAKGAPEESRPATTHSAFSSANGYFEVGGLVLDPIWITVQAPGFLKSRQWIDRPAEFFGDLEFFLERGGSIQGTVRDSSGFVAEGVLVMAEHANAAPESARELTYTDASGHFQFLGLAPGAWTFLAEDRHGRRAAESRQVDVSSADLDLTLEGGVDVSGRIQDAEGQPAVGVSLALLDPFTDRLGTVIETDTDGRYLLPEVPTGDYVVVVFQPGAESLRQSLQVEGFPIVDLDFSLPSATLENRGE